MIMARYLLDTNHASPLVTPHHPLRQRFFAAIQAWHEFAVCAPVVSELWYGISSLPRAAQNRAEWQTLGSWLLCYALDRADARGSREIAPLVAKQRQTTCGDGRFNRCDSPAL